MERELSRYADLAPLAVAPIRPAPSVEDYRVRAKLVVDRGHVGLYAVGTHEVVDIPGCRVLAPALRDVAATIRQQAAAGQLDALLAVDLREVVDDGAPGVLVTLVLDAARDLPRAGVEALARAAPGVIGVATSRRAARSAQLLGTGHELVTGSAQAPDRVGEVRHLATHGAFVQAHRAQAAALQVELVHRLDAALGGLAGRRGFDLYAGSGALGLALAQAGAHMTLVEAFPPAADAARAAARWLPPGRVEVVTGDAARVVGERAPPDFVVVDPPRRGLAPEARKAVAALAPRAVAYVSCNPATLARDLDAFARLGFRAGTIQPYDMIPLTAEIEALTVLAPGAPPALRVLYEDGSVMIVDKPAHEAPDALRQRVRALSGWEAATPLGELDAGTSGACAFARGGERLAGIRRVFIAGVRGIANKGVVNRPVRGAPARTRYRRLAVAGGHSVVRVEAEPAGTQQIRRHLAGIGHPVLGDGRFGHAPTNRHAEERHGLDRSFLHCARVELDHGATGRLAVDSPLAADLASYLARVGGSIPALS